jgi:hypothetical protein
MELEELLLEDKPKVSLTNEELSDPSIHTYYKYYHNRLTLEKKYTEVEVENKIELSDIYISDSGLTNETWVLDSLLDSRIINIEGDVVTLEYKNEDGDFEEMEFEMKRFNHIAPIKMFDLIRIELLEKECGDYRVKILSGLGLVDPKIFDDTEMFDSIPDEFFVSD